MASSDFKSILALLEQSNKDHGSDIYIKSLDLSSRFKKFSGKQNKDLVGIISESPVFHYHFYDYFYQTLSDLSIDKTLDISSLNTIDRLLILLQLRSANVGKTIKVSGDIELDLEKHIENVKNIVVPEDMELEYENFHLLVGYPNLKTTNVFEKLLVQKIKQFQFSGSKEHRQLLSTIFLYDILVYIKEIKMKNGDDLVDFNFKTKSSSEQIEIVNTLPSDIILKIVETIDKTYSPTISDILTINENGSEYDIEINPAFFLK